ncbi:hypothetical protein [Orrella marina]|uniref:LTXXQ motif family protein n=1 Tax=Orrella marina TaxID=2163011 RepID=A0A2R4XNQ0_9BURK|nr:hypothetical protein [Orrella marina]AWB35430.1 hypothetical protein DBV39_18680 [Orrella marina]
MKRSNYVRPLIAGLTLAIASSAAFAQANPGQGKGQGQGDGQRQQYSECDHSGKGQHEHGKGGKQGKHGNRAMSMQLPDQVLSQLNLNAVQQAKYAQAQKTTETMKQSMRGGKERGKGSARSGAEFDPRAMFERQNERFEQMQAARKSVQQEWLGFWDSLNKEQQSVLQEFVQSRGKQAGMSRHGRG